MFSNKPQNKTTDFFSNWRQRLNIITTIILTVLVVLSVLFVWQNFFQNNSQTNSSKNRDQFTVVIDKMVILQEVQALERLETVRQTMQREVEVTIDLGDLAVFGHTILENKRTQKFSITGYVIAGIDLSGFSSEDIELDTDTKKIKINIPAPEIFDANILEDQTRILQERITVLYNLETLNPDRRKELNEQLLQLVIRESKKSLVNAACESNILELAEQNASQSMQKLFGSIIQENFIIETTSAQNCSWQGL